jgi:choline kinase
MRAIILCAGQGTRLLPHTAKTPKCLVRVCGTPILDYQLRALAECGVTEPVLVVGYEHEQVRDFAQERAVIVMNEKFATTNSLYSLWLAEQEVAGQPFVLVNGDVVFDSALVRPLIRAAEPTASLVDTSVMLRDGEMNVIIAGERIVEFSKEIPAERAHAQSLQITKFGAADAALLFARIEELIESGETARFPAFAYDAILLKSTMTPTYRRDGIWFEVDTLDDLEAAEIGVGQLGRA